MRRRINSFTVTTAVMWFLIFAALVAGAYFIVSSTSAQNPTFRAQNYKSSAAAPCTGAVTDNFNGADQGPPPNSNWTTAWRPSTTGFTRTSNQAVGSTGGDNSTYWNTNAGPNLDVYATMNSGTSGNYFGIALGLTSEGTSGVDGYEVVTFNNQIFVQRVDNNSNTTLGATISQTFAAGDSMCIRRSGSTISVYYKVGAGSWTFKDSRTDSTYTTAGKVGIRSENMSWDNFSVTTLP